MRVLEDNIFVSLAISDPNYAFEEEEDAPLLVQLLLS